MEQPLEQGFEPGTMFNRKRIFTPSIRTAREKKMRWGRDQQRKTHLEIKKYRNKMKLGRTQAEIDLEKETETQQKGVSS